MAYLPEERETIITMDDSEPDKMTICTHQRKMISKLSRIASVEPTSQEFDERGRVIGVTYVISSKRLSIRSIRPKKGIGNEERFKRIME